MEFKPHPTQFALHVALADTRIRMTVYRPNRKPEVVPSTEHLRGCVFDVIRVDEAVELNEELSDFLLERAAWSGISLSRKHLESFR